MRDRQESTPANRVMCCGRIALCLYTWGFCWSFGHASAKKYSALFFFWFIGLGRGKKLFSSHSDLYVSAGNSYFFISSPRFEELAGWSHPSGSNCSLSSCVGHHSQMVRNHSRLRSSVIYAQQSFMHERTVWFVSVNGSMPAVFNCLQRDKYNVDSLFSSK